MLLLLAFVVFVTVVSAVGAAWRTRPQVANLPAETRFAFAVLVLAGASVLSTGPRLGPYVVGLAPLAFAAGWLVGRSLAGTLKFWIDPASGKPMFRGGAVYFVVLASSALTRLFLRYLLTGSITSHHDPAGLVPQALMVVAGALLFMDAGLYFARAQAMASSAGRRLDWRWLRLVRVTR